MKKEFVPGKVDRKEHIRWCVEYFKKKYPDHYLLYCEKNALRRQTRDNKYGVIAKGVDGDLHYTGFREGVTIPEMLLKMINGYLPDPTDAMKRKPIIDPPFLMCGKKEGTPDHLYAKKELAWFRKKYPEFATSERY